MAHIPQYNYIVSHQTSFMDLAIIYKKELFELIKQSEPFAENDYNFAGRPPLQADLIYLAILGVIASVISAFYYLRVIKIIYFNSLH